MALFLITVVILIWAFTFWIRLRGSKYDFFKRLNIAGPLPSIWDGNFKELMRSDKAHWLVMEDWIKRYGKVLGYYRTGPTPLLVVADQTMLKDILIKDFSRFTDRTVISIRPERLPRVFRVALTTLGGQDWRRVRNILTPTFTAKKMKAMSPTLNEVVNVMLELLNNKAESGETVDIFRLFQGLTLDVIGSCAFAMDVDCQRNPNDKFLQTVQGIFKDADNPIVHFFQMFPELDFIIYLLLVLNVQRDKIYLIIEHMEKLIHQRKMGGVAGHVDMIQLMVEASENAGESSDINSGSESVPAVVSDVRKKYLSDDEMISNSFTFLVAGYETTANCLGFTAYLLTKHPEIQERLFDEIRDTIGLDVVPDYDKVQRMPYLEMIIAESLRLFPPVTTFVTRVASEDVTIQGQRIPAGTGIEVPVWHLHHDPEDWPNPYDFDPERFSPENKSAIPPMAYLPFGAGPRNCIGMRFAQLEIKIAFVRILQLYRLVTCEKSEPEIQLAPGIATINPKNGVFVQIEKRKK